MFRCSVDTSALRRKASDLRYLRQQYIYYLLSALRIAALAKIDRIAVNTPRSLVFQDADGGPHYHMQDRWALQETADGVEIHNPAPYGGFVAKEPVDAFGARVEAYHNRELRAELDTIEEDVRDGMVVELATSLPKL